MEVTVTSICSRKAMQSHMCWIWNVAGRRLFAMEHTYTYMKDKSYLDTSPFQFGHHC